MAGRTLNTALLMAFPAAVVTLILPVSAPSGTVVVILVLETTLNEAGVPLNLTFFVPLRLLPVIDTAVPTTPAVGLNPEITGSGALTVSVAVSVLPEFVPVIVYVPALFEPQTFALQVAPPEALKLVDPVTLPREFPYESKPLAVYVCVPPALIVAVFGEMVIEASGPAVTVSVAVSVLPEVVPVIVYVPALFEPQTFALQVAAPEALKLVDPVTSPREFPFESKPWAV